MNQKLPRSSDESKKSISLFQLTRPYARASYGPALWQLVNTLVLYFATLSLMFATVRDHYGFTLLLAPLAAVAYMRLFMIGHDAGHGSFLPKPWQNKWVGNFMGVLTNTPIGYWARQHQLHHQGNGHLDRRGNGDVEMMTLAEFQQASPLRRLWYRVFRNPFFLFGIAAPVHFVLMQRYPLGHQAKTRSGWISVMGTNLGILVYYGTFVGIFGLLPFLWVMMPVVLLSATGAVWLFYVQHQFQPSYFRRGREWNYERAAVEGSSFYDLPKILHWACANIGYHHIHHLNPKVPNYRLAQCHRENQPLQEAATWLSLRDSLRTATLALWDEENQELIRFREIRKTFAAGSET